VAVSFLNFLFILEIYYIATGGRRGRDRMVVGLITIYPIIPITTNVVSSNPYKASCTQYNIHFSIYTIERYQKNKRVVRQEYQLL
jgi:hypothetical protein